MALEPSRYLFQDAGCVVKQGLCVLFGCKKGTSAPGLRHHNFYDWGQYLGSGRVGIGAGQYPLYYCGGGGGCRRGGCVGVYVNFM